MPYVNVRVTSGITTEQSKQIVREMTDTLVRILHKQPEHTHIVIDEIDGFAGSLTSDIQQDE